MLNVAGRLTVDGQEYGLLRKTERLSFGLELLYHWADKLALGRPDTWTTAWRLAILKIKGITPADSKACVEKYKTPFSEATMDFMQLLDINYNVGFRCSCWHGEDHEAQCQM